MVSKNTQKQYIPLLLERIGVAAGLLPYPLSLPPPLHSAWKCSHSSQPNQGTKERNINETALRYSTSLPLTLFLLEGGTTQVCLVFGRPQGIIDFR